MSNLHLFSIQRLLRLGIREDTSFIETQKTYMFNLFLLIASPFAFISLVINLYQLAFLPAFFNVVQLAVFILCFRISKLQKGLQLRPLLLLILSIVAIIAAYYYKNGSEYRLLVMMIAAVVIFDKTWQYFLFACLLSVAFVWIRLENQTMVNELHESGMGDILEMLLPLFLFMMSLFYFKHIYFKNLEQLEKANKLLSLAKEQEEKILHTVAHDLRSPITNISAISNLMLQDGRFEADQREFIKLIGHSSDASLTLINDLMLNTNNINDAAQLEQVDLNKMVNQLIPMLQFRANEKGISIQTEILSYPLMATIDADRIERVITNLVTNAIKFSHEKSMITICLYNEETHALLIVKDQGIGISKENHEQIFDMFTNAKRKGTAGEKSFGLGLSICKQLVEQHNGSISVESEVGKGSAFFVRLPLNNYS